MTADTDPVDVAEYQSRIDDLRQSISNRNYLDAIGKVNAIINQVLQTHLLAFLDIRAEAYALAADYKKAESDAKRMIAHSPDAVEGYARQGDLYAMYGYQTKAINAYNTGLQNARSDSTDRLVTAIAEATKRQNKRVDIIGALHLLNRDKKVRRSDKELSPSELADKIISLLPHNTVAVGMEMSRYWRERILECSQVWTDMSIAQYPHPRLIHMSLHTVSRIKKLTMDTSDQQVRCLYFKYMRDGKIARIESLTLTANATCRMQDFIIQLCIALLRMKKLTCINIDFGGNPANFSPMDVLHTCRHLTDLTYTARGSLKLLDAHDTSTFKLTRLKLRALHIPGNLIEGVLKGCPELQQLIVDGCDTSIFYAISRHTPKLQVLGYNAYEEIMPQHQTVVEQGLRIFYTKITNGTGLPASILLPFLYQHMATLENICVHIGNMTLEQSAEFAAKNPEFRLKNLRVLKFAAKKITQRCLLKAIHHTRLEELTINHVYDTDAMVEAVKTVSLVHFSMGRIRNSNPNTRYLVSLFTEYAEKPLTSVKFYGSDAITDRILQALVHVAALRHVTFSNLGRIAPQGIDEFFMKARQLETVKLASISAVADSTLAILGDSECLRTIDLEKLPAVTNRGLTSLKRRNGHLLVRINDCPSIAAE